MAAMIDAGARVEVIPLSRNDDEVVLILGLSFCLAPRPISTPRPPTPPSLLLMAGLVVLVGFFVVVSLESRVDGTTASVPRIDDVVAAAIAAAIAAACVDVVVDDFDDDDDDDDNCDNCTNNGIEVARFVKKWGQKEGNISIEMVLYCYY